MFVKQFENLTDFFLTKGKCSKEDRDIVVYGLSVGFEILLCYFTSFILGLLFNLIFETLVFISSYNHLRKYSGGFHCEKSVNCYLVSCGIVAFTLVVIKFMPINLMTMVSIVCIVVSAPIIVKYAPVEAVNKPLDKDEKIRYRKFALIILLIECILAIILILIQLNEFALSISISMLFVGILLVVKQKT